VGRHQYDNYLDVQTAARSRAREHQHPAGQYAAKQTLQCVCRLRQLGKPDAIRYTDTIIGADALAGEVQTAIFNVLYTTPTKIPQTDSGMQMLLNAASSRCSVYVSNGFLASGTWNAPGFGTLKYGDLLTLGFYVYAPSMLLQSEADRAARKAPLMQIAAKCAGAIHTADVLIFVNQ
jgi:hypothetical protein